VTAEDDALKAYQEAQLKLLDWQRELYAIFESLNEEDLKRLKDLLRVIVNASEPGKTGMYWLAWAESTHKYRFDHDPVGSLADDDSLEEWLSDE